MTKLYDYFDQIILIKRILKKYKENNKELEKLIEELERALCILQNFNQQLEEEMKSLWFELEIVNSIKLSENRVEFTNKELVEINNIIDKMDKLMLDQEKNITDDYWVQKSWYS